MPYPTDLTTEEFELIRDLLPKKKAIKPRKWTHHQILNAILYVLISGCQWRLLPKDLMPWKTAHYYFLEWSELKVFDEMLKKTLKSGEYNKVKRNIQLYYLQTHRVQKIQIGKGKKIQDLTAVKR